MPEKRNPTELRPVELAFLGELSAEKANLIFNHIRYHRREYYALKNQLLRIKLEVKENGVIPDKYTDTIQYYEKKISSEQKIIADYQVEFDRACEEAGHYIGPYTLGGIACAAEQDSNDPVYDC